MENHDLLIKIATDTEWIKERLGKLEKDVEELKGFKFKVIGVASAAALAISLIARWIP